MMELAASEEWDLGSWWRTTPAACQSFRDRTPGPDPHPRAGAPSCGHAAAPIARGLSADLRSRRLKKQETQKVSEPGGLRKVEARSGSLHARAWRELRRGWGSTHEVRAQTDPLKCSEVSPSRVWSLQILRAKGICPYPDFTAESGRRAWAHARTG